MRKKIRIGIITAVLVLPLLKGRAQVIQQLQNSFILYSQTALQEKIFVHTDKTTYLPGEIIWFKIYCVDGVDHRPLNLSKVVYVDILDAGHNPVAQAKIAMKNGIGDGSIYLPVSVNNGNYKFRAYTSWMKNFSPDYYFEKMITLVNPLKIPENAAKVNTPAYDVQFFPEGGNLIRGVQSKVAFKAVGQNGKGINVTGIIIDQRNDTVAKFSTLKFGMGSFMFTPAANNSYKAVVNTGNGKAIFKDLPEISSQGYVMNVNDNGAQLAVTISGADGNVFLFAHTMQVVKVAETLAINNGMAHFAINKSVLGDGITHITIFNNAKQPICERLYFKRPAPQLFIDATADQPNYARRKKVNINLQPKDASGKTVTANLSMAVYRVDSLQAVDHNDIFGYLWLSSDLKGIIESPDYYFKNPSAETDKALDNLMLTQGWRRFQWSQVLENKPAAFTYVPEYMGHIINATITNVITNKPAPDILTYIGIPGKRVQVYASFSDTSGHLKYNTRDMYGPGEIVAQTNQQRDSTYRIDIQSPFSEQFSKTELPKFELYEGINRDLQAHSLSVQVLNIYSGNNIRKFYDAGVDSSAFYGKPYKTYKLDDFTRFTTMEEDLREYVSEDNIVKSHGKFHIKVLSGQGFLDGDPLTILDGVPIFDIDKIMGVDPLKVKKLEVVRERFFYGPSEQEGIFSFTTYKGDLGGVELDPRAVVIDYEGLQLHRQFYSPTYDTPNQATSRIPDLRNLLYWSPSISTSGKNTVSFFTSDQAGKYIGVVQGLTADGNSGSQYFTFEVK